MYVSFNWVFFFKGGFKRIETIFSEFFTKMKFDNADQAVMLVEVKQKNRDLKEVVKEWKDANPDKWRSWIPN